MTLLKDGDDTLTDSYVYDANGKSGGSNFKDLVILDNVNGVELSDLVQNGNIVLA